MKELVEEVIKISKKICNSYKLKWKKNFFQWSNFEQDVFFDFSVNFIISIANKERKKIEEIIKEIKKEFEKTKKNFEINFTESGYINFSSKKNIYQLFIENVPKKDKKERIIKKKEIINLEYVSANPTGDLHIGNLRHAVIGETLSKIYDFLGFKVIREYYVNDRGNQINNLTECVKNIIKGDKEREKNEEYYESAKEVVEILKLKLKKDDEYITGINIKEETIKILLEKIKNQLEKIGIKFDVWFSENSLYRDEKLKSSLIKRLKEKMLIYEKDGAVFFDSKSGGDDKDRVLIKSNGDFTYFFSDIMYQENKIKRNYDKLIVILGSDHHGYIKRLKTALELLNKKENFFETLIVQMVGFVNEGKFKKFSKRIGKNREEGNLLKIFENEEEKLIFFLIEKNPNQTIKLNINYLKENEKKTKLYYIQYAYARCCQIIERAKKKDIINSNKTLEKTEQTENNIERIIISLIIRFEFILEKIIEEKNPSILVNYLINLSKLWQQYYQKHQIIDRKNLESTLQRISLTKAIKSIIKIGLNLIGIEEKNKIGKKRNEK